MTSEHKDIENHEPIKNDEKLFLVGPANRWRELKSVLNIMFEFVKGFRSLHFLGPCITIFGSSQAKKDEKYYKLADFLGRQISHRGFAVMTGGGPGIMEAANRGARVANGTSIGCHIDLPLEPGPNHYLDVLITLKHFFVRKVLFVKYSCAFVFFPGGFSTLDELFETLTLVQTKKLYRFPIVLIGRNYWTHVLDHFGLMHEMKLISKEDTRLFLLTDSVEECIAYILEELQSNLTIKSAHIKMRSR